MRKPTGILSTLSEQQQAQIAEWLLNGIPYYQVQALVEKEYKVRVNQKAFCKFWQDVCGPALLAKRARAVSLSHEIAEDARKSPGNFDEATIAAISQKAFELAVAPGADVKAVESLFNMILKHQAQIADKEKLKIAMRQVALAEQKYHDVQEQKKKLEASLQKVSKGGLTPEALKEMEEAVRLL
jgi:hypothetical protein